ncbi:hypothetical protein EDB84DRAFT_1441906, partial [Lactarius hengduanensis]
MSSSSPLLQSPPSSSHHFATAVIVHARDIVAVFESQSWLAQLVADIMDAFPRSAMLMWSWSVIGYWRGLRVAWSLTLVRSAAKARKRQRSSELGLHRHLVLCVVVVNAAPEDGLGARVPAVVAAPAVIVKAVVCTTNLCERRKLPVKCTGVQRVQRDCPCQFHSTS